MRTSQVPALDTKTWEQVQRTIAEARTQGLDVAEELNRRGLILSPARRREIRTMETAGLVVALKFRTPVDFLTDIGMRGKGASPADMHRAVLQWLEGYANAVREGSDE